MSHTLSHSDAYRSFDDGKSYECLAGTHATGFNGCIELCDRWAASDRIALLWVGQNGEVQRHTFGELRERAAKFAEVLVSRGIQPGDRVAGLLPRTPDLLTVFLGVLRAGAVYQPLFTAFGPKAIESRLQGSEAALVVTDKANRPKLDGLDLAPILVTDGDGDESLARAMLNRSGVFEPVRLPASAPFLMMFTSGTTGTPKGVLAPLHMLRSVWAYMRHSIDLRPDDIYWNMADPGWAYGLYYALAGPLLLGQPTILSEAPFSVEKAYGVIRQLGVTNLAASPTAYRQMAASGDLPPPGVRVISSAGEPLDRETAGWLAQSFGAVARDHYGQTELGMVICDHHGLDHPRRDGAIGYPMPGFRVTTLSPSGAECAPGQPGMLAIDRNSPLFWFTGYYERKEQPFVGDHYITGDSAVREADGAFRFLGREDDVITSSGYRIGPFEIESVLLEHPAVAEAAVIGRPDPIRTEVVKAFVSLGAGHRPTEALATEIRQFVKTRLAAYSYPREIEFVDQLPKTPSGKVQRFLLREQEVEKARRQEA